MTMNGKRVWSIHTRIKGDTLTKPALGDLVRRAQCETATGADISQRQAPRASMSAPIIATSDARP